MKRLLLFLSLFTLSLAADPVPVDVYTVQPTPDLPVTLEYPARLESTARAVVTARITGVLLEQTFKEGDPVEKGTLLYKIEPDLYAAAVREREAEVTLQEAVYAKAQRDWTRAQALFKEKTLSRQEYDAALSAYETAGAAVHSARARLASAKVELSYTQVTAPISGIAGTRAVDPGNVVSPGTPLVTITRTAPLYAAFALPGADALRIKGTDTEGRWKTNAVSVRFTGENGGFAGTLDYLAPAIDPKTGTLKARALLPNKEGKLIPGAFGRVALDGVAYRSALAVPEKAVLQSELGPYLYVVTDGKAAARNVTLEGSAGQRFIIGKGIAPGEEVIVNNFFKLKDGAPVTIDQRVGPDGKAK